MLPWDVRSLVGSSSPRFRRCFLSRHFSAYCKVRAGSRPKRNMRNKHEAMGVNMLPQTEGTRRIGGQTPSINDGIVRERSRKPWLVAGIAFIAVAAIFGWGVWSRVRARRVLNSETAQVARQAVSVVSPERTAPA